MKITAFLDVLKATGAKVDLKHIAYNRITTKSVVKDAELTDKENEKIADAVVNASTTDEMAKALELGEQLIASKRVKFEWSTDRHPIAQVTGNETRANIGIMVNIPGTVELPEGRPTSLPKVFGTFVWRNYCVVRDGELNISVLPIEITKQAHEQLTTAGVKLGPWLQGHIYEVDMAQFEMTDLVRIEPRPYAKLLLEETYAKAVKKVLKHFMDQVKGPEKSKTLTELYGQEAAEWLATLGITDQGYAPASEKQQPTTTYEAKVLSIKTKGLTIPSVAGLQKKLEAGKKLNPGDQYLATVYQDISDQVGRLPDDQSKITLLELKTRENKKILADVGAKLSECKMAILTPRASGSMVSTTASRL